MWNDKRREAEAQRDEALQQAEQASATARAAQAERDELKQKYEPPVKVRQVIPSAMETNRRKH